MNENLSILFESLRRTDALIATADQKASFTLAAGITFLGIYSSIIYNISTDDKIKIPTVILIATIILVLTPWGLWLNKIRVIFNPNIKSSTQKSIISFTSITQTHNNFDDFIDYYKKINNNNNKELKNIEVDILENHWICADICKQKMNNFRSSLNYLWVSLILSLVGIIVLVASAENTGIKPPHAY